MPDKLKLFLESLKEKIKEPTTANKIALTLGIPESTCFYYINQLIKRKELIYVTERKKEANNYPVKKYFINPLKNTTNASVTVITKKHAV